MRIKQTKSKYRFAWGENVSMFALAGTDSPIRSGQRLVSIANNFVFSCKNRFVRAYYLEDDLRLAHETGKLVLRKSEMKKYFKGCLKAESNFLKLIEKINSINLQLLSKKQLLLYLKKYLEAYQLLLAYYQISTVPEYLDFALKKLKKLSFMSMR